MAGHVTPSGVFVEVGAARLPLPATAQTVREWVTGLPDLCPECHEPVCDCIPADVWAGLLARIDADPHGVNDLTGIEIPF